MLCTVEKIRSYIETTLTDNQLAERMAAVEAAVRAYTNNHFLNTRTTSEARVRGGEVVVKHDIFLPGDSVEINHSMRSDGVYTVTDITAGGVILDRLPLERDSFKICLIQYPADVVMAGINMLKWSLEYGDKIGIKSETLSRWSVSYADMDSASEGGYPKAIMTALKAYRQARV